LNPFGGTHAQCVVYVKKKKRGKGGLAVRKKPLEKLESERENGKVGSKRGCEMVQKEGEGGCRRKLHIIVLS